MNGYIQNEKVHSESEVRAYTLTNPIFFCGSEWLPILKAQGSGEGMNANGLYREKQWMEPVDQLPGHQAQLCPLGASRALCPPQLCGLHDSTFLSEFL